MAIKGDGAGAQHEIVAVGSGLPANTNSMCIAIHGRIDSDLNRLAGIANLVKYSGTPTAHVLIVDSDGTSLKLLSNYFESDPTGVVANLGVGDGYTMFIEGSGTTLTLSVIKAGETSIATDSTTQTAFVPERLYLLGTNSSGSNESADGTIRWVGIWNTTLNDTEKRAVHLSGPSAKSGAITNRPFTGGNLANALSTGSGAIFTVGGGGGITYTEWEDAPAPVTITISGSADVDLQDATIPDPGTAPDITTSSLPSGQVGVAYSAQIAVTGTAPISVSVSGLPAGLAFNPDNTITGTPTGTGGIGGTYTVTITAENAHGSDSESLSLVIADAGVAPPVITTELLPEATVGVLYEFTFSASGAGPYTWTFSGLPVGMAASGATISGPPSFAGIALVWVRASGPGGLSVPRQYELRINPAPAKTRIESPWASVLRR